MDLRNNLKRKYTVSLNPLTRLTVTKKYIPYKWRINNKAALLLSPLSKNTPLSVHTEPKVSTAG